MCVCVCQSHSKYYFPLFFMWVFVCLHACVLKHCISKESIFVWWDFIMILCSLNVLPTGCMYLDSQGNLGFPGLSGPKGSRVWSVFGKLCVINCTWLLVYITRLYMLRLMGLLYCFWSHPHFLWFTVLSVDSTARIDSNSTYCFNRVSLGNLGSLDHLGSQ